MKRQKLSKLLGDLVLAGSDGGHLRLDGVDILAQGNSVLLLLIPVSVEAGGKCVDLVDQGLGRARGDLRVAVHWVARAWCGCWDVLIDLLV